MYCDIYFSSAKTIIRVVSKRFKALRWNINIDLTSLYRTSQKYCCRFFKSNRKGGYDHE